MAPQKMLLLVSIVVIISQFFAVYATEPVLLDIRNYGVKNGDISEALPKVWAEAINSSRPTKIFIAPGTWTLSQAKLHGPNKAPLEIEVQGTVKAFADPHKLPNKDGQWWTINYLDNFTISGGGVFDGQGHQAWTMNDCHKNKNCMKLPINLSFNFIKNAYIHDVTTKDSKNFHVNCISSHNVTFQRFRVSAPGESINTDGLHIARGSNIKVIDSIIETGDDCVSMGDELTDVLIQNVTCGPGHGISIGSLGKNTAEKDVARITVKNCTFIGTQNGVRVKTWPSAPATLTISDLRFEDLIMINVSSPVIIDQEYCPWNLCSLDKPSLIQVKGVTVKNVRGTSNTKEGLIFSCSSSKPCQNVEIGDVDLKYVGTDGATITTKCNNVKPTLVGKQNMAVCAAPAQPA